MERVELLRKVIALLDEADDLLQGLSADEYEYLTEHCTMDALQNKLTNRLRQAEKGMLNDWRNATRKPLDTAA